MPTRAQVERHILNVAIPVGVTLILFMLALYVLTDTNWGREKVRGQIEALIQRNSHGIVHIGKVTGNLRNGFTLQDVVITDSAHKPFIKAKEMWAQYSLSTLFGQKIEFDNVKLIEPVIVLDKMPGEKWNWDRIFPRDTITSRGKRKTGWGTWIRFTNVTIVNGDLTVRSPWQPNDTLSAAKKAEAVRNAFTDQIRFIISRVRGGFQKTSYYHNINAFVPLLRLEDPAYAYRRGVISHGNALVVPFKPPSIFVRDIVGTFDFTTDSVWWKGVRAVLPNSVVQGDGMYSVDNNDMRLRLHSDRFAAADIRWVHPPIPESGYGKMDFDLDWVNAEGRETYMARNADLHLTDSHLIGNFGITYIADTFAIHQMDVRFTGLDTHLIQRIFPTIHPPVHGILAGYAKVEGGEHAMDVNGDVTLYEPRSGRSRLAAVGQFGFDRFGINARNLRLRMMPVQVALLRQMMPGLKIGGVLTGPVTLNGNSTKALIAQGDVTHVDKTGKSNLIGRGTFRFVGTPWFDIDAKLRPLSLATIGQFAPAVGLRGFATGPLKVRGSLRDFAVNTDLAVSGGGFIAVRGNFDLASRAAGYNTTVNLRLFDANAVIARLPRTSVTGFVTANGSGTDPATMRANILANISESSYDTLSVQDANVKVAIANGMANIDTLGIRMREGVLTAAGSFGMRPGTSGDLRYHVAIDSLGKFAHLLPPADTGTVSPRPGILAQRIAQAKSDSTALAKKTEVERQVTGRTLPPVKVDTPTVIPKSLLAGSVRADGIASGNIRNFSVKGTASGENVIARGSSAKSFTADYQWINARTPQSDVHIAATGTDVRAAGFALDTVNAKVSYHKPNGTLDLVVHQDTHRGYAMNAEYVLNKVRNELRLNNLKLQFDTTLWTSTHAAGLHWGTSGVDVDHLELRNKANGRIFLNGFVPKEGPANFEVAVDNFDVANAIALLESDIAASGLVSLDLNVTGTAANPAFHGALGTQNFVYNGTKLPELHGTMSYANQTLTTNTDVLQEGVHQHPGMLAINGTIPINLAFTGVQGSRFPSDREIALNIVADSLPLDLVPQFSDIITDLGGKTVANFKIAGTLSKPRITGEFKLTNGKARVVPAGINVNQLNASIRLLTDTIVIDSVVGNSSGRLAMYGGVGIKEIKNPTFNLKFQSDNAQVLNNDKGNIHAIAALALQGQSNNAYVTGNVRLRDGVIYIPESTNKTVIGAGDPALFNVMDTSIASNRELFPAESPLLAHLRVDVALRIDRDVFVRSRDANIEIFSDGDLLVHANRATQALALDGVISTERGEYSFLTKRFQIKRGSATFLNQEEINPTLQGTAEYEVRLPAREAIRIRVVLGGTLKNPTISLESDAEPPIPQSDLLSYLAFGRPSGSLLQLEGTGLTNGGSGGENVIGAGAALATKQLAAVALGVAADEAAGQAARSMGADVFNITPADVQTDVGSFLRATEVEFGKYIKSHTFISFQARPDPAALKRPGLLMQHYFGGLRGYRLEATFAPRFLLKEPSLAQQTPVTTSVLGLFLIREWRF